MATRHRRARREFSETGNDGGDVSMGDVTDATLPEAVPRNADGTASEEGEVSEEQAQLIGSLSLESAAKNKGIARRLRDKALGKKGVAWNVEDALEMFSFVRTVFAAEWNSIVIHVSRIEPEPKVQLPPIYAASLKDTKALYDYIEQNHGAQGPARYKVFFRAGAGHERGAAYLYMPDKSAPPVVQTFSPPSQSQPQQPPPQAPPYGYSAPPGYGAPPTGWSPPQSQQPMQQPMQQPQGDRVFVISPPAQQTVQSQPQQAPPPPAPVYVQPSAPPPGAFDPQRTLFEMMQAQNAQMMATLEKVVERMNQPSPPPPPAGFIALPSEQYPVPPGYVRIPGGMIPAPNMAMYAPQPQAPTGVGAVPVQPPPVAYAAPAQVPAQAVVVQAPPAPTFDQQIQGTVGMMKGVVRGMGELQNLFTSFAPQQQRPIEELEPEEPENEPPPPNPLMTTDVGGITMAIDRATGKTNWPATLMGALPKIGDTFKSGLAEYQKLMDRNAQQTARVMHDRTVLANAIAAAKGGGTPPAVPPAALPPAQPAQQPAQQVAPPVQQAPQQKPQAPAPPPPRKPAMPMPNGPIWGS
jgi:hypothetical protein